MRTNDSSAVSEKSKDCARAFLCWLNARMNGGALMLCLRTIRSLSHFTELISEICMSKGG